MESKLDPYLDVFAVVTRNLIKVMEHINNPFLTKLCIILIASDYDAVNVPCWGRAMGHPERKIRSSRGWKLGHPCNTYGTPDWHENVYSMPKIAAILETQSGIEDDPKLKKYYLSIASLFRSHHQFYWDEDTFSGNRGHINLQVWIDEGNQIKD